MNSNCYSNWSWVDKIYGTEQSVLLRSSLVDTLFKCMLRIMDVIWFLLNPCALRLHVALGSEFRNFCEFELLFTQLGAGMTKFMERRNSCGK